MLNQIQFSIKELIMQAYLEVTLEIANKNRDAAVEVYKKYKEPFLSTIPDAQSKSLLVRKEDVQVLHGFSSMEAAESYLASDLFTKDVVNALTPLLDAAPEMRIYEAH
jgi:hypothetical protein